jgi:hypothetical protein
MGARGHKPQECNHGRRGAHQQEGSPRADGDFLWAVLPLEARGAYSRIVVHSQVNVVTGQETFLPKQKILERIEKIKALKDTKSLEEIAQLLSPELKDRRFERDEVLGLGWLSREVLEYYETIRKESGPFSFRELILFSCHRDAAASTSSTLKS